MVYYSMSRQKKSKVSKPRKRPIKTRQPGGRTKQANENDLLILAAAKEVFVADPSAPIAAVAAQAKVGIAALYGRYHSKENLLATLCANGQRTYIATAEKALASGAAPFDAYAQFLRDIVAEDTHVLSSRLAGTFTPTIEHANLGEQLQRLGEELFSRVQKSGQMRTDICSLDVGLMLEGISQVRLGDASRSAEIRQRLVSMFIDALRFGSTTKLPGPAPSWTEQNQRWIPK